MKCLLVSSNKLLRLISVFIPLKFWYSLKCLYNNNFAMWWARRWRKTGRKLYGHIVNSYDVCHNFIDKTTLLKSWNMVSSVTEYDARFTVLSWSSKYCTYILDRVHSSDIDNKRQFSRLYLHILVTSAVLFIVQGAMNCSGLVKALLCAEECIQKCSGVFLFYLFWFSHCQNTFT